MLLVAQLQFGFGCITAIGYQTICLKTYSVHIYIYNYQHPAVTYACPKWVWYLDGSTACKQKN